MTPFFSVVIPVYDRAHSIGTALDSVLSQTEHDFEIIIVDDGSHDDPQSVVAAFNDPRIRFVRQTNGGGGAARNAGIDLAGGRFVAFLDSDDTFLPHHLAVMRRLLTGTENVAAYAPMIVDRGNGISFVKPPYALAEGEHMANYLLCRRGFVPTITLVVPRELATRVRYNASLPCSQDTDFAIRLFLAGCRFLMAPEPAAVWRDEGSPTRVSAGRKTARLLPWIETLRSQIPPRAYHGGRGWMIAKGVAMTDAFAAMNLWLQAVLRGCYRPTLAAVVFLQIFLSDRAYRRCADWVIAPSPGTPGRNNPLARAALR
ncbi:MAG TPA: glycosyltransferase [Rhizomicrobium sp.]|nr:glycosyltransferase [Rhizomicrobium sp.]